MKVDTIIKNAKIFTADKDNPQATALAVKDGKFIYVGDEAGLSLQTLVGNSSCQASWTPMSM